MMGTISGIMTGLLLVIFIGIWIWAWSGRNKEKFDSMAKLPLEEESSSQEENRHD